MNRKRVHLAWVLFLASAVLLLGMASAHYQISWLGAQIGAGGKSTSVHYRVGLTTDQSPVGGMSSAHYKLNLGFEAGAPNP